MKDPVLVTAQALLTNWYLTLFSPCEDFHQQVKINLSAWGIDQPNIEKKLDNSSVLMEVCTLRKPFFCLFIIFLFAYSN